MTLTDLGTLRIQYGTPSTRRRDGGAVAQESQHDAPVAAGIQASVRATPQMEGFTWT